MATSGGIVVRLLEVNEYIIVTTSHDCFNIKVTVAVISVDKHTHALVSLSPLSPRSLLPVSISVCMMFMCGMYVACG